LSKEIILLKEKIIDALLEIQRMALESNMPVMGETELMLDRGWEIIGELVDTRRESHEQDKNK